MKLITILRNNKIIILILILGFLLRLIGINRGLWGDEQISINTLKNNTFLNPFYFGYTTNLPLYFYILKLWTVLGIFQNILYIRLLGITLNLLNIWILFKYFEKSKNPRLGMFLCFFIAITPLQIHYAQEIRPYILTQLLISIHFIKTIEYLKNKNQIPVSYFLITIILILTHYAAYLYLGALGLIIICYKKTNLITKRNIIYFFTFLLIIFSLVFLNTTNPKFTESFLNTGIFNYKWSFSTITEMIIRIKEVVSFYFYFGFWYYLASPITQNIFKKIATVIFIFTIVLIIKIIINKSKLPTEVICSLSILAIVMITGFYLEKFGVYPFGGRHIMPFSIFLYLIVSFGLNWILDQKYRLINIGIFGFLIATFVIFLFHQNCVIKIAKNQPNIKQEKSYSYCLSNFTR